VPCTAVLPPGPGVCSVCRGPAGPGSPLCFCCAAVAAALAAPLAPVIPISTYRIPGPLHTVLRGYKDAPISDARRHYALQLSTLLGRFLALHRPCLEGVGEGPLDVTVAVPPSSRPGDAPLHAVGGPAWARGLLVRANGPLGHLRPSVDGFAVPAPRRPVVDGKRVLLVEDTLTTGARAQSAAAALRASGALAVVVVVVGRVVRPELNGHHAAYWHRARAEDFRLGRCSLPACPGGATAPARSSGAISGWRSAPERSPTCRP